MNVERRLENIGSAQRLSRLGAGSAILIGCIIFSYQLLTDESSRWWYLVLLFLYQNAFLLIQEYRKSICPVNALRGRKSMTGSFSFGKEKIEDLELAAAIKKVSNKMTLNVTLLAIIVTVVIYLIDYYL